MRIRTCSLGSGKQKKNQGEQKTGMSRFFFLTKHRTDLRSVFMTKKRDTITFLLQNHWLLARNMCYSHFLWAFLFETISGVYARELLFHDPCGGRRANVPRCPHAPRASFGPAHVLRGAPHCSPYVSFYYFIFFASLKMFRILKKMN